MSITTASFRSTTYRCQRSPPNRTHRSMPIPHTTKWHRYDYNAFTATPNNNSTADNTPHCLKPYEEPSQQQKSHNLNFYIHPHHISYVPQHFTASTCIKSTPYPPSSYFSLTLQPDPLTLPPTTAYALTLHYPRVPDTLPDSAQQK